MLGFFCLGFCFVWGGGFFWSLSLVLAILFCISFPKLPLIILKSLGSLLVVLSPAQQPSASAFLYCSFREVTCCPKQQVEKSALFSSLVERLYRYSENKTGEFLKLFILQVFPVLAKQTSRVTEMQFVFRQRAAKDATNLVVHLYYACDWYEAVCVVGCYRGGGRWGRVYIM